MKAVRFRTYLALLVFILVPAFAQSAFLYRDAEGAFFLEWVASGSGQLRGRALVATLEKNEAGVWRLTTMPFSLEGTRQGARVIFKAVFEPFPLVQDTWTGELKGGKLHLVLTLSGDPLKMVLTPSTYAAYEKAVQNLKARVAELNRKKKP